MVMIWSQHYCSSSRGALEDRSSDLSNVIPVVASNEVFQPTSACETAIRSHVLWVGTFDNMKEETRGGVQDRFSGRARLFPYKIGKFGLGCRYGRSVNTIPILMTGIRSRFSCNIWSMKRSRFMSNERTLIRWSCAIWSGTRKFGWSWFLY